MTKLLEQVFTEVEKLPEVEQNALAKWLLTEISSEKKWDKAFADSEESLDKLAHEALQEYKQGKTKPLNPEIL